MVLSIVFTHFLLKNITQLLYKQSHDCSNILQPTQKICFICFFNSFPWLEHDVLRKGQLPLLPQYRFMVVEKTLTREQIMWHGDNYNKWESIKTLEYKREQMASHKKKFFLLINTDKWYFFMKICYHFH